MKKNIIILVLTALCLTSSGMAYRQYTLAQEYKLLAIENEIMARENAVRAEEQARLAEMNAMEANRQRILAQQAADAQMH